MQTQNPFLDEFSKLTTAAMGLAQAATEEARAAMRAQVDRVVAEFDLVRRDEYEALQQEVASLREEIARLGSKSAKTARSKQEAD
jgi:BMFP domain-containing protein YqiC